MAQQFDKNGLRLTTQTNTLNAYLYTAFNSNLEKWQACARMSYGKHGSEGFNFTAIDFYEDARDAAHVAQTFAKWFNRDTVRDLVDTKRFRSVAKNFLANLQIPKWQWPSQAASVEEIRAKRAYDGQPGDAKEALRFVILSRGLKMPSLQVGRIIVEETEQRFARTGKRMIDIAAELLQA